MQRRVNITSDGHRNSVAEHLSIPGRVLPKAGRSVVRLTKWISNVSLELLVLEPVQVKIPNERQHCYDGVLG